MNRIFIVTSVSSVVVRVAAGGRPYTCPAMAKQSGEKLIVDNRRARHDYHLSDRVEAGVVLTGTEVKSLRGGEATLQQAYAEVRDGEAWLVGLHVPEYTEGNRSNHDPDRARKLLLHRKEIERLASSVAEKGLTVVPTRLYFRDGRVKVELAVGRGKELRDKRRDIAARDAQRQIDRELKSLRR
jgi:SsrA-binding protein